MSNQTAYNPVGPDPYCPVKTIKTQIVVAILKSLSSVVPLPSVRRAYLRAFHADWDERTKESPLAAPFDDGDVYNGHQFNWSPRVAPKRLADVLLEEHDARVARECAAGWNFQDLLEQNLHS